MTITLWAIGILFYTIIGCAVYGWLESGCRGPYDQRPVIAMFWVFVPVVMLLAGLLWILIQPVIWLANFFTKVFR